VGSQRQDLERQVAEIEDALPAEEMAKEERDD
jgi:hypothetical protein